MKQLYIKLSVSILAFLYINLIVCAQTWKSTTAIESDGYAQIRDITTDAAENTYSVGYFTKNITAPGAITGNSNESTFILRTDASGVNTLKKDISGGGNIKSYKVLVDASGNIYVAGSLFGSTIRFSGFTPGTNFGGPSTINPDGFIAKYSSTGNFLWVQAIGSADSNDEILDMAFDSNGDIYVTGYISNDADVYGKKVSGMQGTSLGSPIFSQGGVQGLLDVFVAKFGQDGTYKWGFSLGSEDGSEKGTAIAIDAANNVYVAGQVFNTMEFDPLSASSTSILTESTPQGSGDAFIAKYNSDGDYINVGQISGASTEIINTMHIGSSGALNVAGSFSGFIDADIRSGNTKNLTAAGIGKDILFASYNLNTFAPIFIQRIGASNLDDDASGIKANASGDIYLTGYFSGSAVNFNTTGTALNLSTTGGKDMFVAKYNAAGINQWGFKSGSVQDDEGSAMNISSAGNIYACGFYKGAFGDLDPGAGTSNLPAPAIQNSFWSKYQECSSSPVIATQPSSQTFCEGATIHVSIAATGSGLSYKWKRNSIDVVDGANISGATTNTLTITASTSANAGTYTAVATSCGISVTSANAVIVVNSPPVITTQPIAQSVCYGTTTSFNVVATGTLLTYQWKFNGNPITNDAIYSGAQAATLNIINATANEGGYYTCTLTSSCAPEVTTASVALIVSNGIKINTQPTSTSVCLAGNTSYTVVATGSNLTYDWLKNNVSMTDGGSVSGSKSSTLTLTGVATGDATNYKCLITSSCGTAKSATVYLTISNVSTITSQPVATQNICSGQSATFSVVANGAVSYQWKKDGIDLTDNGTVSGSTTATLSLTAVATVDAATYSCVITGSCGPTVTSADAKLIVSSQSIITNQPTSKIICSGLNTNFEVLATGTNLVYQWQKNNVDLTDGLIFSGVTTNKLSLTGVSIGEAGNYICIVTGACAPTLTTNIASLTVNSSASITSNPANVSGCIGQATNFTLGTNGSGITFQWKKGTVDLVDDANVSGAKTSVLSILSNTPADAGIYSCTITNTCSGVLKSTDATLVVNSLPIITSQPTDVTICGSGLATFSITATGTNITYQWKKNNVALTDGANILGAKTASLSLSPASASDAGAYTCIVSGVCNPLATSNVANLAVGSVATITGQPINKVVCTGTATTFSITVLGTGISYKWKKDGLDILNDGNVSGASTATLSFVSVSVSDAASYTCVTGNICSGFITSDPATLSLNTPPSINTQPVNASVCVGSSALFSVTAVGTSLTYQWKKGGLNLTDGPTLVGSQTANLNLLTTQVSDEGMYSVEVSGACPSKANSSIANLTLASGSVIVTQPVSKFICSGTTTVLNCNATGGSLTYQWKKDGIKLIEGGTVSGSTTFNLALTAVTLADAGSYTCEVSSACSPLLTSDAATVNVSSSSTITSQPISLSKCEGSAAMFSVVVTGTGLTYQWKNGSVPIAGATNATYSIASISSIDAGTYTTEITTACGLIISSPAELIVNTPVVITQQPKEISSCPGENAVISVITSGSVVNYKWFKNSIELIDGGNISNATTSAITISTLSVADEDTYSVEITGLCNAPIMSGLSLLTLSKTPAITNQPVNTLICEGQPLQLTIGSYSAATILYQWKKDGVDIVDNGTTISGAKTSSLTITGTSSTDAGNYTCTVATSCSPSGESDAAIVTTTISSPITKQPISSSVCRKQSVLFMIEIAGSGLTYNWQYKSNGSSVYTDLVETAKYTDVASNALIIKNVDITEEGAYRCVVTEACGAIQYSAPAALILNSPTIIKHPFPQSICIGQLIQFDVVATGNSLKYQWFKDGVAIKNGGRVSGAIGSTLKIEGSVVSDNGDYYCSISGICTPNAISEAGTLTVSFCTGISAANLKDGDILIYPKPANQSAIIEFQNQLGARARIILFDLQGAFVLEMEHDIETDSEKINFESAQLPQGLYIIHIQIGNQLFIDKLEVIH